MTFGFARKFISQLESFLPIDPKIEYCELSCYCLHFLYFWLNKRLFFSGYFIRRISGTIKRFWCIRYGTNIEVKIRDCPGAFGTDGGSVIQIS